MLATHHRKQSRENCSGDKVSCRVPTKAPADRRMLNTFQQVDLTKNFYFSSVATSVPDASSADQFRYSYDITNTLQTNLTVPANDRQWNTRFMWNHHLLSPAFELEEPKGRSRWVLPLIHGFVDQASKLSFTGTRRLNEQKSTSLPGLST